MSRSLCFCLLVVMTFSCSRAVGQATKVEPTKLRQEIKAGTVKPAIARSLGLACGDRRLESVVNDIQLAKSERYSVVQAYDAMCDARTLIVFRFFNGEWKHAQTVVLSTLVGVQPTVTFPQLFGSSEQQILVSGQLVDHGTGVEQKNLTIYRLINGHLEVVFDAPESVHIEQPSSDRLYSLEQRSEFKFLPNSESDGKEAGISEKQELTQEGKTIVRFRSCTWAPDAQRYRCYEHAP